MPEGWTTVKGLWLLPSGLAGTVLTNTHIILCFEQSRVIEVEVDGWTMAEVIECLANLNTPSWARPEVRKLTRADLQPLISGRTIDQIEALRCLALVPGWTP